MGFWKDKARKDWMYKFEHLGKQYGGRGYRTKAEAAAAREEHRKRIKLERHDQKITDFKTAASLYLDQAKRQFVYKTYKQKAFVIKEFMAVLGNRQCDEYAPQEISAYLLGRPTDHNFNSHRKDLSVLFNFIKDTLNLIQFNPVMKVVRLPHTPSRKYVPPESDVLKVLLSANKEQQAFLLTLILTGSRVDEIYRLTWRDINFDQKTVTRFTRKRKGGNYAAITTSMTRELEGVLWWKWENRNHKSDLVFPSCKTGRKYQDRIRMIKSLCKKAGIEKPFTFHALRHFVASLLADKKKISKKSIGDMLGHMSLATTEIYLHSLSDSAAAASNALEGVFELVTGNGDGLEQKWPLVTGHGGKEGDQGQ
jgi:integrase